MCKKLCLAVGAVIVGLLVLTGTGLGSLLQAKYHDVRIWMSKQVPIETKVAALKHEMNGMDADIKKNLGKLAKVEVETEQFEGELTALKERQTKAREEITAMTKALDSKTEKVSYNNQTVRTSVLTAKLEEAVSNYENRKADIKTRELVLAQKRQSLELAHQRISEMKTKKEQLRVDVAELERRIESLKLKQVDCPVDVDGSAIGRCNATLEELKKDVATQEREAELYSQYGYGSKDKSNSTVRETKVKEDVLKAAQKALQDDNDDKVVDQKQ